MKGHSDVISHLQRLLNNELMARDQYFAHARQYKDWGLEALGDRMMHEMEEEAEHAQKIIDRMLFLEAEPCMNQQEDCNIASDIEEMMRCDLEVEYAVGSALKAAIKASEQVQDYITRSMLTELLDDTETDHTHWLEQQLRLIKMIGKDNYIQAQMMQKTMTDE